MVTPQVPGLEGGQDGAEDGLDVLVEELRPFVKIAHLLDDGLLRDQLLLTAFFYAIRTVFFII